MTDSAKRSAKQNEGAPQRGKGSRRQPKRPSGPTTEAGTPLVLKKEGNLSQTNEGAATRPAEEPATLDQVEDHDGAENGTMAVEPEEPAPTTAAEPSTSKEAVPADTATVKDDNFTATSLVIQMLPTSQLRASGYNPNEVKAEQFQEYLNEVRHLGRLPKPIVVRETPPYYTVVDGELSQRIAIELRMPEVPCEVIQADDFEAMRQTYKRNQHGRMNPVLLGRMFQRMMKERNLKRRALAREIDVSEGTIRNALLSVKAVEVRKAYAFQRDDPSKLKPNGLRPEDAEPQIAALSAEKVRAYMELPVDKRDEWLDQGAQLPEAENLMGLDSDVVEEEESDAVVAVHQGPENTTATAMGAAPPREGQPGEVAAGEPLNSNGLTPEVATCQQEKGSPGQAGPQASTGASKTGKTAFRTLEKAWKKATPKVRSQFLDWLVKHKNVASKLRKMLEEPATAEATATA